MHVKKVWQQVDGVLLLDKDCGMTSNAALQKARRVFSAAKGGHTGTLDPLASGLLPLCFGEATKFSADLLDADKTYLATLQLGVATDSGDADGQVIARCPVTVTAAELSAALPRFRGDILQIPPMHSALKRDGRPLYELARQGIEVERAPRPVTIRALDVLAYSGNTLELRVRCSKGTYIRSLAIDLGAVLGCGAHLTALRRSTVGALDLAAAVTLAQLEALPEDARVGRLLPVGALLRSLPRQDLEGADADRFSHGNPVAAAPGQAGKVRVYAAERLIGVGERGADGRLWPKRLVQLAA